MEKMLLPVWNGAYVWRETFAMIMENGRCSAPFLYEPDRIERIESYDGTQSYELGRDCYVEGRELVLTADSRIPHTNWDTFYDRDEAAAVLGAENAGVGFGPVAAADGSYLKLNALGHPEYITKWQLAVTYTSREAWQGYRPASRMTQLPLLYDKLRRREPVKILLYGDSISCGCDCSGMYGQEPLQAPWYDLVIESLRDSYGCEIEFVNTSVGGVNTDWAIDQASQRAVSHKPDLVLLGFGMNDRCPGGEYAVKMSCLRDSIASECPDTEYVLIATTLPNPLTHTPPMYFSTCQEEYGDVLHSLCRPGTVVADVQAVQKELMRRKRYFDITGNLLNHPNDYLARIQAQVLHTVLRP